jgi:plastocyanin
MASSRLLRGAAHACASALLLLACADAGATQWTVDVGGAQTIYTPALLEVTAGDTVTFVNRGGFHNVVADDASFRCAQGCDGAGGSGDPSDAAWSATVTLATPGTVGYHCEVHGLPGAGMFGSITVAPRQPAPPPAPLDTVPVGGRLALLSLAAALLAAALLRRRAR